MTLHHHINQAVKAHVVMKRDRDYVVQNGEVIIVDDFTGRLMHGRRYSDGLHQSIEAKEGLHVQSESMTLAIITLQNFFRMYQKLSGMTGTAKTEADEFRRIYNLDVIEIPTNKPMIREDLPDVIYKTEDAKFRAVIKEIAKRNAKGQPLLVGTVSIENSERISDMLSAVNIGHSVLNAKFHEQEAEIVAKAGQPSTVTIATNMAGRGTDIVLGEGVAAMGGLHIIATERHESRRIDNQLRGRAGRQGDPGSTQFYLSLEDDLMRKFGGEQVQGLMDRLGIEDDQPIESKLVTRSIESSQKKVEANNFDARRVVLQYDDVMNKHRGVIYSQRAEVLISDNLREPILSMIYNYVERLTNYYLPEEVIPEEWDLEGLLDEAEKSFLKPGAYVKKDIWGKEPEEVLALFNKVIEPQYDEREEELGEQMREFEKVVVLKVVDSKWMDHIDAMDQLRQGIHLRAYGQANPLIEYQREGYEMFNMMIQGIEEEVTRSIFKAQITSNLQREKVVEEEGTSSSDAPAKKAPVKTDKKIGRNEPCPCGSGKKYKHCCGAN
jgi:preprotein translocase subunit SecA